MSRTFVAVIVGVGIAGCEASPEMVEDEPYVIRGEGTTVTQIDDEGEVVVIGESEPDEPQVFVPNLAPRAVPSHVVEEAPEANGAVVAEDRPVPVAIPGAEVPVFVPVAPLSTAAREITPSARGRAVAPAEPVVPSGAAGDPRPFTGTTAPAPGAAGDPRPFTGTTTPAPGAAGNPGTLAPIPTP